MARFQITADPYQQHCDCITSVSDNLKLSVIDTRRSRKPQSAANKYTYEVTFGAGNKADKLQFIIGNTELPMTKALWDKQLLLSAIGFYQEEKGLDQLSLVRNTATGNIVFKAEGIYEDGFGQDIFGDETRGWS